MSSCLKQHLTLPQFLAPATIFGFINRNSNVKLQNHILFNFKNLHIQFKKILKGHFKQSHKKYCNSNGCREKIADSGCKKITEHSNKWEKLLVSLSFRVIL